jgi:hypothetical protein
MTHLLASDHRLPDLRFVPVEALLPHEQHDSRRLEALARRLKEETVLKNPPVVTPLPADGFLVLDGANRAAAVREAGHPHLIAQVVPYEDPHVMLSTWSHALGDMPRGEVETTLRAIPGLTIREQDQIHARAVLARREALAYVAYEDGCTDTLEGGADLAARNALLNAVVDCYRGRQRYFRVPTDSFAEAAERNPGMTALVVFPHFEPAEIVELALTGSRLPAGITRHLIRWRALRLNLPIERMADRTQSLEQKNHWLAQWLQDRFHHRQVRFYEEPTVSFDE